MLVDNRIIRTVVAVILPAMGCATARANTADTIVASLRERLSWLTEAVRPLYENPAVKPLQYRRALTALGIDTECCKEWTTQVNAETFQHLGASTVWGNASYSFGKIADGGVMVSSVTPDATVYPYLPATDNGGVFSSERYSFMGGYSLAKGGWSYGVALSYDAWLSYRTADPRPKNTSGTLCITAGIATSVCANRYVAAMMGYTRYTQSSSVMFVSQQGADPIYHLTGLGSRYRRFDGMGWGTNYAQHRFLLGVSTYPHHEGWMVDAQMQTSKLSVVLPELNNLPMSSLSQYDITATAGYKTQQRYVGVHGLFSSSSGTERIFGDPMASVYPVIASQKGYSKREVGVGANGVWCVNAFTLRGEVGYRSLTESRSVDMRSASLHTLTAQAELQWQHFLGRCLLSVEGGGGYYEPLAGELQLPLTDAQTDAVGARLANEVRNEFNYADSRHLSALLNVMAAVPLKRVTLCGGAAAVWERFNSFNLYLSICF